MPALERAQLIVRIGMMFGHWFPPHVSREYVAHRNMWKGIVVKSSVVLK